MDISIMLKTKRQRDQAACGLIVTIPVVLFLIIFCAVFVRNKDKRNAEMALERASEATAACWASQSSALAGLPSTEIFLPMLSKADYATVLGFGGNNSETTTWGIATKPQWCSTDAPPLPESYLTYTIDPLTARYNHTVTDIHPGATSTYTYVSVMNVYCTRQVLPWTVITLYAGSSYTREAFTREDMTCTWAHNYYSSSTWFTKGQSKDGAYIGVTLVGDTAGLMRTTTTDASRSPTSTLRRSMVTETRAAHRNSTFSGTAPVTSARSTTYLTASTAASLRG